MGFNPMTDTTSPWDWAGMWVKAVGGGEVPDADPTDLTASFVSASQIDLAWTDNATNEDGYKIERSDDGGAYTQIAKVATEDLASYSDTTVVEDTVYTYRVRAYNGTKNSGYSNTDSAETLPAAPSNLAVSLA